jgi:hypothetical protein
MPNDDVPMTRDRELWECPLRLLDTHGRDAIAYVADLVAALARTGDEAGIRTWRMIDERIDALRDRAEGAPP